MALSPELKAMVSRAQSLYAVDSGPEEHHQSVREQLAWLGYQKATKSELQQIVMNPWPHDKMARLGLQKASKRELHEIIVVTMEFDQVS